MATVTVSQKGWVVIPAKIRRQHGIKAGDRLRIVDYGGCIGLMPEMNDPVEEAWGMFRGAGLLDELKKAKAEERRLEKRRKR
ncbi:MAG TPA: AbrB/MazE/SpoVT family DNA-binding domain-containing protein [Terriglobia bacterium]|nr:AbrB/MazE/SpoVT family DNA-binding domain-containing protein [Terriglobia bacterium]